MMLIVVLRVGWMRVAKGMTPCSWRWNLLDDGVDEFFPASLRGGAPRDGGVRWREERKISEQIAVGADAVRRYLPVGEDCEEVILDVISEGATILRIRGR